MQAKFLFKTAVIVVAVLLTTYAISALSLLDGIISIPSASNNPGQYFSVHAESTTVARPDTATITISAETQGQTAQQAQELMNQKINRIVEVIKAANIDEDDFKTTSFNISPQYNYSEGESELTGYSASSSLQVRTTDFDILNSLVDQAVDAGADRVSNVSFIVDEQDEYIAEARQEAIESAQEKAKKIANEAGIKLGKLVNIDVNEGGSFPQPAFARVSSFALEESADSDTSFQTGTNEISVSVTLYYELD